MPARAPDRPLRPILLAEDDPLDVVLLNNSLSTLAVDNPVLAFADGAEVIAYLQGLVTETMPRATPPCLLLLDLKMPRVDGFEVISWMRAQPALAGLPIVIISGMALPEDLSRAMALGAGDHLLKPVDPPTLWRVLHDQCRGAIATAGPRLARPRPAVAT